MDSANESLCALEAALNTSNRRRLICAAAALHDTWARADVTVATMRARAAHATESSRERWQYKLARNTVLASRYFARAPLRRMWTMLQNDLSRQAARTLVTDLVAEYQTDESTRPNRPDPRAAAEHALAELQIACGTLHGALELQDPERVDIAANALAAAWLVAKATTRVLEMHPMRADEEIRVARLVLDDALRVMGELFARAFAQIDAPKLRSVLCGLSTRIRLAIARDGDAEIPNEAVPQIRDGTSRGCSTDASSTLERNTP
jgi:hypothetical protein